MMLPFTHPSYVVQCLFFSVENTVKAEGCLIKHYITKLMNTYDSFLEQIQI